MIIFIQIIWSADFGNFEFIPYYSAIYTDSSATDSSGRWGGTYFRYESTATSYLETKIQNERDEHGGPVYLIQQTMDYIDNDWL